MAHRETRPERNQLQVIADNLLDLAEEAQAIYDSFKDLKSSKDVDPAAVSRMMVLCQEMIEKFPFAIDYLEDPEYWENHEHYSE